MSDIAEYREIIRSLAEEKSSDVINNQGKLHAACVMSAIFDFAKNEINMLSGQLNSELTSIPEYFNSLLNYLSKDNVKLNLFLEKEPELENQSNALKLVLDKAKEFPERIIVKFAETDEQKTILAKLKSNNNGNAVHFAYADDQIYRLEYVPSEYKASVSFNNRNIVASLRNIFQKLFDKKE